MHQKTKKIIILDDDLHMLNSLKRKFIIEKCTYDVMTFTSAKQAIQELSNGNCFAFITDIMMPDITGDYVIAHIRKTNPQQPCIVITGLATREKISRIVKSGNTVDIISKPIDFSRLLKALNKIEVNKENGSADQL